jgi:hypothetical protein
VGLCRRSVSTRRIAGAWISGGVPTARGRACRRAVETAGEEVARVADLRAVIDLVADPLDPDQVAEQAALTADVITAGLRLNAPSARP